MPAQEADTVAVDQSGDDTEAQQLLAEAAEDDHKVLPWEDPEVAKREIEKLRKENASWRTKNRELTPLAKKWQEKEDSEKSEADLLREQVAKLQEENSKSALEALRNRIVLETGCPPDLAALLSGSEEEMVAQATSLADKYGGGVTDAPAMGRPQPTLRRSRTTSDEPANIDDFLRQAGRR